jgi:2-polyprenyl-6-methoxyphenol hydroxylase-like FAD-dependent oxidoreductase
MQVFKKLGIHDKIEKLGNKISYMKITDTQLNPISTADLTPYETKYGVHNIAIHRGELQKILIDAIGSENINVSKRLSKIEKKEVFQLTFDDNSTFETKFVIGADGIKSTVREQLFKQSTIRNAKQICWRGICEIDLPQKYHNELNEAWGKGKRFGFVKISSKKVYWYALANTKKIKIETVNLEELFEDFHSDILNIIAATPKTTIRTSEITDLKPIHKWQDKKVCLVGDAAHATTPNLGQGACQAIEDAYVLGKLLDSGISLENTFHHYEKLRRKKAHTIVKTSWVVGKIAHIENDFGIWLRNMMLKKLSKSSNKKQMNRIFELD